MFCGGTGDPDQKYGLYKLLSSIVPHISEKQWMDKRTKHPEYYKN